MALAVIVPVLAPGVAAAADGPDIQVSNSPADPPVTAGGGAITIDLTFWSINSYYDIAVEAVTVECWTRDAYGNRRSPGLTVSFKDPTTGSWSSGRTSTTGVFSMRPAGAVTLRFGPFSPHPDKVTIAVRLQFSTDAWNGTWRMDGRISDYTAKNDAGEPMGRALVHQGGGTVMQLSGGTAPPPRSLPPTTPRNTKPQNPSGTSATPASPEAPPSPAVSSPATPELSTLDTAVPVVNTGAAPSSATSDVFASLAVLLLLAAGGYALYSRRRSHKVT